MKMKVRIEPKNGVDDVWLSYAPIFATKAEMLSMAPISDILKEISPLIKSGIKKGIYPNAGEITMKVKMPDGPDDVTSLSIDE